MYPRNSASPERISIGAVVQISDGSVQSSGVDVKVIPFGGSESSGAGTVAYSADGVVLYTPTQGETNYTSFILIASKTGCIPATVTVVTSAAGIASIVTSVYAALPADHTVAGSYGARFLLAFNSNRVLQLTGNHHAAADVHEFQPDVLTSAATDVSFVNELQSGLATSIALATAQADLDDIQTRLPAALVSGRMDSAVGDIDPAVVTIIQTGLSTLTAAQVNAEIVDALSVDTYAEPTAVPAASSSLKDKLAWLFMLARNRLTQTASTQTVFRDDTTTPAATAAVSDDGTTATRSEFQ